MLATVAQAAVGDTFTLNYLTYTVLTEDTETNTGTVSVVAEANSNRSSYRIPPAVTYNDISYTPTKLGKRAFYGITKMTGVTIPAVCADWSEAELFRNSSALTSITIPDGVTVIGNSAFGFNTNLKSVYVNSIEHWLNITFSNDSSNPLCISGYSNDMAPGLYVKTSDTSYGLVTELIIPESITEIKNYAFSSTYRSYDKIEKIWFHENVNKIGIRAIGSKGMKEVHVASLKSLLSMNIDSRNSLFNGSSVNPGADLYVGDEKITDLVVPDDVTAIKSYTLNGCGSVQRLFLHDHMTSIGADAITLCLNLTEIHVPSLEAWCGITLGGEMLKYETVQRHLMVDGSEMTEITIPQSVTAIKKYAFAGGAFTAMNIHNQVTSIGDYAFSDTTLPSCVIPNSVRSMGVGVFSKCANLTDVTLSTKITKIPDNTFSNCTGLKEFKIPSHITTVGKEAFSFCTGLEMLEITEKLTKLVSTNTTIGPFYVVGTAQNPCGVKAPFGYDFGVDSSGAYFRWGTGYFYLVPNVDPLISNGLVYTAYKPNLASVRAENTSLTGEVEILQPVIIEGVEYTVTTVEQRAFKDCKNITNVIMPEGITNIGKSAFQNCENLTTVDIPSSVSSIFYETRTYDNEEVLIISDSFPWEGCDQITSFTVDDGNKTYASMNSNVLVLNDNSKKLIKAFHNSKVPSGVKTIIGLSFSGVRCQSNLEIPSSVIAIGPYAFQYCTSIETLNFAGKYTTIGKESFSWCRNLKEVNLPDNITEIKTAAFQRCNLTSVRIPTMLTTIGASAFSENYNLSEVGWNDKITNIGQRAFRNTGFKSFIYPSTVTKTGDVLGCDLGHDGFGGNYEDQDLRTIKYPNSVKRMGCDIQGNTKISHITLPTYVESIGVMDNPVEFADQITELTLPKNSVDSPLSWSHYAETSAMANIKSLFIIDDEISEQLRCTDFSPYIRDGVGREGYLYNKTNAIFYVKPSVYNEKYSSGRWGGHKVDYRIPVKMTSSSGNPIKYKTLCRDFDVDLTHTNDNLPEGVEPLRAYLVDDVEGELRLVFLNEIKYIPSRLKANVRDENGNLYQGVDEYVGVILRGTPGYTYYYEMGEHDYTQGAEGQWLMEDAMAYSGSSQTNNMMAGDANDDFYVYMTVEDEDNQEIVNYGLNNNRFKIYYKDGWLGYNKSYLQLPRSVSDAIERHSSPDGFANLTMVFENADGTTDKVSAVEFVQNAESDIFYNPYGQRVSGDAKGVVISNGKKKINR